MKVILSGYFMLIKYILNLYHKFNYALDHITHPGIHNVALVTLKFQNMDINVFPQIYINIKPTVFKLYILRTWISYTQFLHRIPSMSHEMKSEL